MATPRQLPSGLWFVQLRIKGKSVSRSFKTEREAWAWESSVKSSLKVSNSHGIPHGKHRFKSVALSYLSSYEFSSKKPSTRAVEERDVRRLCGELGDLYLDEITPATVSTYRDKRLNSPSRARPNRTISNDRVRLELCALSNVLNFAIGLEYISRNPVQSVKKPKANSRPVRVAPSDQLKALSFLLEYDYTAYLFFRILSFTGCRPSELSTLKWSEVNIQAHQITKEDTKNGNRRTILLPKPVALEFSPFYTHEKCQYIHSREYVFSSVSSKSGKEIPYQYYNKWLTVKRHTGIKVHPYALKHEYISQLVELGGLSDQELMALTGHKSPNSFTKYAHPRAESKRSAQEAMAQHLIDNLSKAIGSITPEDLPSALSVLSKPEP